MICDTIITCIRQIINGGIFINKAELWNNLDLNKKYKYNYME